MGKVFIIYLSGVFLLKLRVCRCWRTCRTWSRTCPRWRRSPVFKCRPLPMLLSMLPVAPFTGQLCDPLREETLQRGPVGEHSLPHRWWHHHQTETIFHQLPSNLPYLLWKMILPQKKSWNTTRNWKGWPGNGSKKLRENHSPNRLHKSSNRGSNFASRIRSPSPPLSHVGW